MLRLIAGCAAIFSLMMIAVSERDRQPPQAVADPIVDRWIPEDEPAPKADRLPLYQAVAVNPALVDTATEASPPPAPPSPPEHARRERDRRTTRGDICARHGLHKVTTRGGKSWRCRRGA